jgi:hypothetical protein
MLREIRPPWSNLEETAASLFASEANGCNPVVLSKEDAFLCAPCLKLRHRSTWHLAAIFLLRARACRATVKHGNFHVRNRSRSSRKVSCIAPGPW